MDMVEKVARALIERIGSPWPYDKMDPVIRELWHGHARAAIEVAEIERLQTALRCLLNVTMYKDHPVESQMAIDALGVAPIKQ